MCLAVPGKIISIDDAIPELKMAKVDFNVVIKKICIQWVDAGLGDYVLAHAGMAISVIDETHALDVLEDLKVVSMGN